MRTSLMTLGVGTKNPSVNTTITPAIFDPDFFKKPNNRIYHIDALNDESILKEWKKIRESLNTGISPRVLLSIVRVAMQIKTCDGSKNIMQLAPHQGLPDSLVDTDLSESKIPMRAMKASRVRVVEVKEMDEAPPTSVEETSKCKSMAIVASYLCCAILRLLKKSPSTFLKGIPSIIDTFSDFYYTVETETIDDFSMSEQMAHVIHAAFNNSIPLQRTVVFYLANAQDVLQPTSQEYILLKFILAQHIELKGLHAYKLYVQAFASVEGTLSNPVFMSWLTNESSILPLKMIGHIIMNYDCDTHRTNLFKYARYLEDGCFYDLHTKNCLPFVYVLSKLIIALHPYLQGTMGDPTNIEELKTLAEWEKETGDAFVKIFLEELAKVKKMSMKAGRIQHKIQGTTAPKRRADQDHAAGPSTKRTVPPPTEEQTEMGIDTPPPPPSTETTQRERSRSPLRNRAT